MPGVRSKFAFRPFRHARRRGRSVNRTINDLGRIQNRPLRHPIRGLLDTPSRGHFNLSPQERGQVFLEVENFGHPWSGVAILVNDQEIDAAVRAEVVAQDRAVDRELLNLIFLAQ